MMTQEEKAKRYDETLEQLKGLIEVTREDKCAIVEEDIIDIFPELAESEDERIKKALVEYFTTSDNNSYYAVCGVATKKILAWLDKQGEKKANNAFKAEDWYVSKVDGKIHNIKYGFEKQGEQKLIVEPKFKVGDWITDGYVGGQITSIEDNYPCYKIADFVGGISASIPFTLQDNYHLWTIADAKNGDVLVYGDNPADHHVRIIMLFKSMRTFNSAFNHFHIFADEFRINDWCDCGKTAHPATKEQRDTLFAKMKEAGYEWDYEQKELKKIEKQAPKSKWSEDDEQYLLVCKNALRKYQVSDKWDADIISKWLEDKLKQGEPKPKWTEEDVEIVSKLQCTLNHVDYDYDTHKKLDNWLKSIEQRMGK